MTEKKGYEVIRFLERGANCYTSVDYVKGVSLYQWIQDNQQIGKEVLQVWLREIAKQLVQFHRQRGNPDYIFLNPHNIIITGKDRIAFSTVEHAGRMRDSFVEKYFTPQDNMQECDMYCFGKTIQFIMAHTECSPRLTMREEHKMLGVVKKCLETNPRRQYGDIGKMQRAAQNIWPEKR